VTGLEDQQCADAGIRLLEAYRHDLRGFFQWATDHGIAVMEASRAHIELFRAWMEDRGLAASTTDRRLSTVCGFYRFAHIDGHIRSNPAQYVRRPQVHASDARRLDRHAFAQARSAVSVTPSAPRCIHTTVAAWRGGNPSIATQEELTALPKIYVGHRLFCATFSMAWTTLA
jgi:integrase